MSEGKVRIEKERKLGKGWSFCLEAGMRQCVPLKNKQQLETTTGTSTERERGGFQVVPGLLCFPFSNCPVPPDRKSLREEPLAKMAGRDSTTETSLSWLLSVNGEYDRSATVPGPLGFSRLS
ncbi:hypothetical protein NQZ68_017404 [Dissostichus eleginoides]|nr:hypothetical protein NQZ68_017404 [Dissostichus eleginoides]